MSSVWRMNPLVLVAAALNGLRGSLAQTTNVVCLPYFDWMSNSQHQNPCAVASSLQAVCNGGTYNVQALPDSTHYAGPVSILYANDCQCNTVTYSLMSACAACQGRSYIAWSEWTANCPNVSSGFPEPLPTGLHVPGWAYLDPRPSDSFDQIRAQQNINLTESTLPTPTIPTGPMSTNNKNSKSSVTATQHPSTSNQSRNSTSTTDITSASSAPTLSSATTSSIDIQHANTIGGIAVGAAMAGVLLVIAIVWFVRSRTGNANREALESNPGDMNSIDTEKGPQIIVEAPEDHARSSGTTPNAMMH